MEIQKRWLPLSVAFFSPISTFGSIRERQWAYIRGLNYLAIDLNGKTVWKKIVKWTYLEGWFWLFSHQRGIQKHFQIIHLGMGQVGFRLWKSLELSNCLPIAMRFHSMVMVIWYLYRGLKFSKHCPCTALIWGAWQCCEVYTHRAHMYSSHMTDNWDSQRLNRFAQGHISGLEPNSLYSWLCFLYLCFSMTSRWQLLLWPRPVFRWARLS